MNEIILSASIYITLAVAAVVIEHRTFGRWWAHNELARRTMGIATVMGLAMPFVLLGVLDLITWLMILFAFGAAGATKAGLMIHEWERGRQQRGQAIKEQIDGTLDER